MNVLTTERNDDMISTSILKHCALAKSQMVAAIAEKSHASRSELIALQRAAKLCHPERNNNFRELVALLDRLLYPIAPKRDFS